jgi:hypothetical protein
MQLYSYSAGNKHALNFSGQKLRPKTLKKLAALYAIDPTGVSISLAGRMPNRPNFSHIGRCFYPELTTGQVLRLYQKLVDNATVKSAFRFSKEQLSNIAKDPFFLQTHTRLLPPETPTYKGIELWPTAISKVITQGYTTEKAIAIELNCSRDTVQSHITPEDRRRLKWDDHDHRIEAFRKRHRRPVSAQNNDPGDVIMYTLPAKARRMD